MHYRFIPPTPPIVAPPTPMPSPKVSGGVQYFGICQQPIENLSMWRDIGINMIVDFPLINGVPMTPADRIKYLIECEKLGLKQIREEVSEITNDTKNPNFIAVSTGDEPDLQKKPVSELQALQSKYKGILPTFTNFDGAYLLGIQKYDDGSSYDYQSAVNASDWLSSDLYPVSGWNATATNANGAVDMYAAGRATDKLVELSGGRKPVFQYVETCVQLLPWLGAAQRGPTIPEISIQLRTAEARKVKGIILYTIAQGAQWPKDFDLSTLETKLFIADWIDKQKAKG